MSGQWSATPGESLATDHFSLGCGPAAQEIQQESRCTLARPWFRHTIAQLRQLPARLGMISLIFQPPQQMSADGRRLAAIRQVLGKKLFLRKQVDQADVGAG